MFWKISVRVKIGSFSLGFLRLGHLGLAGIWHTRWNRLIYGQALGKTGWKLAVSSKIPMTFFLDNPKDSKVKKAVWFDNCICPHMPIPTYLYYKSTSFQVLRKIIMRVKLPKSNAVHSHSTGKCLANTVRRTSIFLQKISMSKLRWQHCILVHT